MRINNPVIFALLAVLCFAAMTVGTTSALIMLIAALVAFGAWAVVEKNSNTTMIGGLASVMATAIFCMALIAMFAHAAEVAKSGSMPAGLLGLVIIGERLIAMTRFLLSKPAYTRSV